MIYITGDTHGDFLRFNNNFLLQKTTKDDFVIICGDFGGVWSDNNKDESYTLDWLNSLPCTILFVDGNHENFDRLKQYQVDKWHGGTVHYIRPSVIHLMRGQIFEIDGKTFFTFGGASSHDIQDGVLEFTDPNFDTKFFNLSLRGASFRINHWSWWADELPTDLEMQVGLENLEKYHNQVDYIITHCAPQRIVSTMGYGSYEPDVLTDYLNRIYLTCEFKHWFCGHYHDNWDVNSKFTIIYEQILQLKE